MDATAHRRPLACYGYCYLAARPSTYSPPYGAPSTQQPCRPCGTCCRSHSLQTGPADRSAPSRMARQDTPRAESNIMPTSQVCASSTASG
eukprot:scaffold33845_cov101-Isochrysis_galbana.AAC.5